MSAHPTVDYRARFDAVLRRIEEDLEGDLSLEALSAAADFSRFHFHRQFSALYGVSPYQYIQALRLKRAAYRLAYRDDSLLDIALEGGYDSHEAFSRAFKKRFGQTPSAFRQSPQWHAWDAAYERVRQARRQSMSQTDNPRDVSIVDFPETPVAMLSHRGAPAGLGDTIRLFIAWRREHGLSPRVSDTYNVFYGNPFETPPSEFRLDLCASTEQPVEPNETGVVSSVLQAGRCAVLRHIGSDDGLEASMTYLYGEWLPASGETLRAFPLFCRRVRFFPDVLEREAITELYLPLE